MKTYYLFMCNNQYEEKYKTDRGMCIIYCQIYYTFLLIKVYNNS